MAKGVVENMNGQATPDYRHVILVTVGLSIIDKLLRKAAPDIYRTWMPSETSAGALAGFNPTFIEQGKGVNNQLEVESRCFNVQLHWPGIGEEILRRKQNRYSAEISSLSLVFEDKKGYLNASDCRIVLIATDSCAGVLAARLTKRVMAARFFGCPDYHVRGWKSEADNHLHQSLQRLPIVRVEGLQVEDAVRFEREGKPNFVRLVSEETNRVPRGNERLMIISGGFKAVIPVAIGVAWRYNWDAACLYEETEQLLSFRKPAWLLVAPDKETSASDVSPTRLFRLGPIEQ